MGVVKREVEGRIGGGLRGGVGGDLGVGVGGLGKRRVGREGVGLVLDGVGVGVGDGDGGEGLRLGFGLEVGVGDAEGEGVGVGGVGFLEGGDFVVVGGRLAHVGVVAGGGGFVEEVGDCAGFGFEGGLWHLGH